MAESASTTVCPYCGERSSGDRCDACGGHFDELSRQATQNQMGAWFVRDAEQPFLPGCSYETLVKLVRRGKINHETIVRGPTTRQFWMLAGEAPGVAHLLGVCHRCDQAVAPTDVCCEYCGAPFSGMSRRNELGLAPAMNTEAIAATKAQSTRLARDSAGSVGRDRLAALVAERRLREQGSSGARARASVTNGGGAAPPAGVNAKNPTRVTDEAGFVERIRRLRRVVGALAILNVFILVGVIAVAVTSPSWLPSRDAESLSTPETASGVDDGSISVLPPITEDAEDRIGSDDESNDTPPPDGAGTVENSTTPEQASSEPKAPDLDKAQTKDPTWKDVFDEAIALARSDHADDVERALQLLLGLRDSLAEVDRPDDLEPMIDLTRRRLTRLRLDEVFGDDGDGG
ncbi:MAG: hypothetical protein ACF8PN_03570 [Phycisphaerales bacterium]